MIIRPPQRIADDWGSGHYGAPRGTRAHRGTDFVTPPGSEVLCLRGGRVSKLGYPYANDRSFRYVEVTGEDDYRLRYFYVEPCVEVSAEVCRLDVLGVVQTLQGRFPGITDHVHLEVWTPEGDHRNPMEYLTCLRSL